jgi:hypothetical protein
MEYYTEFKIKYPSHWIKILSMIDKSCKIEWRVKVKTSGLISKLQLTMVNGSKSLLGYYLYMNEVWWSYCAEVSPSDNLPIRHSASNTVLNQGIY